MLKDLNFELPQRNSISTFERLKLSLGLPILGKDTNKEIDLSKDFCFRQLLHTLTSLALKDLNIVHSSFGINKQLDYGKHVFEAYLKSILGSGNIEAKQKNIRWLNEEDTLQLKSKLFTTTKYKVGDHSMQYTATPFAENIMKSAFNLLKSIDFVHNDIPLQSLDFTVTIDNLEDIRLRDTMILLAECIGYNNGFVIRSKITDRQFSRVYSIFTSISGNTRKILGYCNYDIGTALQTICLKLVNDPSAYPIHEEYVADKIEFRNKIQKETGKDEKWVKKELSKINNLDNLSEKYSEYPTLVAYYRESRQLRKEIIATAEPVILYRATDNAKTKHKKIWDDYRKKFEFIKDGKKESSIFFFIWTQWERQIREVMMSCFAEPSSCHQVHDAVYSRQIINPQIIEAKVLDTTGFKINIFVD